MAERNVHVLIIYKSGAKMELDCEDIEVRAHGDGTIAGVTWQNAIPNPLVLGMNEIAAIFVTPASGEPEVPTNV